MLFGLPAAGASADNSGPTGRAVRGPVRLTGVRGFHAEKETEEHT